ncbi:MAG: hypothetical protein ACRDRW_18580 [Pseudonocardiaceae bacterium]
MTPTRKNAMPAIPTPLVDSYLDHLDPVAQQAWAEIDASELEQERARVAPRIAERLTQPTHGVGKRLRAWERLGARLAAFGQTADDYYLIDEYINDLDIRDALERLRAQLPAEPRAVFDNLLHQLDQRFRDVTEDDGGQALRWRLNESAIATALRSWWWQRRPTKVPWTL